jgi:hypothetical protein
MTETKFQTECNQDLDKLDVHYIHISSKNRYVRKGILDLLCWHYGKSFVMELKRDKNVLSKEQIKEIKAYKKHGIPVYVCYDREQFMKALKEQGVIK